VDKPEDEDVIVLDDDKVSVGEVVVVADPMWLRA